MGRVPLLLPLTALLVGILGSGMRPDLNYYLIIIPILSAICLWVFHRHIAAVFSLFLSIGALAMNASAEPDDAHIPEVQRNYSASVVSVREESGSRLIKCDVDGVGKVNLRLYGTLPVVREGNKIQFSVTLLPYEAPVQIVPDELVRKETDIVAEATMTSSDVSVTDSGITLRRKIVDLIIDSGISDRTGAMLCALLIGETSYLPDDIRRGFSAAGISHVLALSGLHVGVVSMLIVMALWPLYVGRHNRTRRLLTIAALWGFAALTGFSPSVTRAVVMATVYLFGRVIERPGVPMNSLCLAAIVILLFDPQSLWSVSFQLSFAAVAGILVFYPVINQVDQRNHLWLYRLVSFPAVSISAMAFTGILSAFYFHSYPLFFLVANLSISPLVPLLIFGGALLVALSAVGLSIEWLINPLDFIADSCCFIAEIIESIPGHSVGGLYFPPIIIPLVFAALLLLALGAYRRHLFPFLASAALLILTFQTNSLLAENYSASEHYFLRDKVATNILIRDGETLYLLTSVDSPRLQTDILNHCRTRFTHYMTRRGITELKLCPDTLFTPYFSRRGDFFSIDGLRYMILKNNNYSTALSVDFMVVSRGFTGDVVNAALAIRPDSAVILSSALDRRRLNRYASELQNSEINNITY